MQFLNFLQAAIKVTTYLFILSAKFFLYTIYKRYVYTSNLSKRTYELGKGIAPEKVEGLIDYL